MLLIPVSIGELLDKISILEIKMVHITHPTKLTCITKEYQLLLGILAQHQHTELLKHPKYHELYTINQTLWKIEDDIRLQEKQQTFREEFIRLARLVYKTNDQRAAIKKYFNDTLHSDITEVKSYEDYSTHSS